VSLVALVALATPAWGQEATDASDPGAEDATEGEEIVVTGVRASIIQGLENKRESTQVIESVVAEDIGKLPDNNVIEALQRVTGVQVTNRGAGEAGAISIRGLPDALTTMNGRNIFTATSRQFALQDIPANLVKRIDVYKTRAAEQIETGIAGQIDVFTRRPLDFDGFAFSALARGVYNEQADSYNPNVSALISNRWETGIGDIGVLVNAAYSRTKWREMSVTAGAMVPFVTENPPEGTGFTPLQRVFPETGAWLPGQERGLPTEAGSTFMLNGIETEYYLARDAVFSPDVHGERERPAVNVALQWAPDDSSRYTAEFFWNRFDQTTFNSLFFSFVDWWGDLGPDPGSTFELYEGTNIIKSRTAGSVYGFNSGDLTKSSTDTFVYALNGAWDLSDNASLTADLSYQTSEFNTEFVAMRLDRVAQQINVDFNAGGGIPSYNFNDNALLLDPAQWNVAQFYDNASRSKGSAITLHVDGVYNFDGGFLRTLKAGLRVDERLAMDSVRGQEAGCLCRPLSSLDPGFQFVNEDFFNGRADVPTSWVNANGYYLYDHADEVRQLYQSTVTPSVVYGEDLQLIDIFDISEFTTAAYIQGDFETSLLGRPLQLQAGLRYVYVDTDLSFTDRYSLVTTTGSDVTRKLLPSVTVRYEITDDLRLRLNYGETVRRPAFADLNANLNLVSDLTGIGRGSGSGGNPNLKPTYAKNYDLSLEWYFMRDSALYGTLFRREIEGLVVPLTTVLEFATPPIPGDPAQTTRFAVTRPENASNGVLEGVELGVVLFPDLPGILDGLGAQGSLTILDSKQNIPLSDNAGNIIGQDESSFFGVSDLSYNVTLAYDRGPVGLRLSYVWRKNFLANNEARLFANPLGVWRVPEKSLDFQLTYALTDRFGVTFDATNITNEFQQNYYRFDDVGGPEMFNLGTTALPRTFALGLRYTFE
jgi:TonB-dependent receptor